MVSCIVIHASLAILCTYDRWDVFQRLSFEHKACAFLVINLPSCEFNVAVELRRGRTPLGFWLYCRHLVGLVYYSSRPIAPIVIVLSCKCTTGTQVGAGCFSTVWDATSITDSQQQRYVLLPLLFIRSVLCVHVLSHREDWI